MLEHLLSNIHAFQVCEEIVCQVEDEPRTAPNVQKTLVSGIPREGGEQFTNTLPILGPEKWLVFIILG